MKVYENKPIVAWSITTTGETTDEQGFGRMLVRMATGQREYVDLLSVEYGVGSYQDGHTMIALNLYVSRDGQWYVTGRPA